MTALSSATSSIGATDSRPTSITSTTGSLTDLTSFNSSLELTLTWLLEAKDVFNKMAPVADDVELVKAQFHEHEVNFPLTNACSLLSKIMPR